VITRRDRPHQGPAIQKRRQIGRLFWYDLPDIPVLDNFAFRAQAKDVDCRPVFVLVRGPLLVAMEYDEVALCEPRPEAGARYERAL
jgi:hypothetical protein